MSDKVQAPLLPVVTPRNLDGLLTTYPITTRQIVDGFREYAYVINKLAADVATLISAVSFRYSDDKAMFANDYTNNPMVIIDGVADTQHRHFGVILEDGSGRLHLIYRRAPSHGATDGMTLWRRYSDNGGNDWSAEEVLVAAVAGFDQRSISACVTPSGRIVVIYAKTIVPSAAPTLFKLIYSDDGGRVWTTGTDIVSVPFSYGLAYGRIKVVPGQLDGDYRYKLAFTPYYQIASGPSQYKVPVWVSDDDGLTWAEVSPIFSGVTGYTEAELVAINEASMWAVTRGGGIGLWENTTGLSGTWVYRGDVFGTFSDKHVAPTIDKFFYNGAWHLLVVYCDRDLDVLYARVARVKAGLTGEEFSAGITIATGQENASGYQTTITRADGSLYFQGGVPYVTFQEFVANTYTKVLFGTFNPFVHSARAIAIASGAATVVEWRIAGAHVLGTEGGAATDDLDTLDGGFDGQTVVFSTASGTKDVVVKNGTGNLVLRNDCLLDTVNAMITLQKRGTSWYELSRNDLAGTAPGAVIASGVATVTVTTPVGIQFVDTEGAAATDDLDTINGGFDGQTLTFRTPSSSRDVTFKDGTGNLKLAGDFATTSGFDTITLVKSSTVWLEVSRSDNE